MDFLFQVSIFIMQSTSFYYCSFILQCASKTFSGFSVDPNYLTISDSTSSLLKVLMVGVIPLAFLGVGVCVVLQKRRQQNESV